MLKKYARKRKRTSLKALKINSGAYLPELAFHIETFCKRAHVEGIHASNLQTYLAQVAQTGGNSAEFWVVFEDNKPVAFACWQVLGLPHISKVYCFCVYSWTKDQKAADLLADEWIKFGQRWNAIWWSADFTGKRIVRLITKKMAARGFQATDSGLINTVFRRVKNET